MLKAHEVIPIVMAGCEILGIYPEDIELDFDIDYEDTALGYCSGDDEEVNISLSNRIVDTDEDITEVIAHELIHAEQYLSGRLISNTPCTTIFDGVEYISFGTAMSYESYVNQPWEKEAYEGQKALAEKIKRLLNE